jgi:nicotinate-nucleotide adenylyltransferase
VTAKRGPNTAFAPTPPPFGDRRRRRVGILGGSFNPAHEGHLHISREALKRLGLHQVWWLVSPQNPLKSARGMTALDKRLAAAKAVARRERRIVVSALEQCLGETRTALTLKTLTRRYPALKFVWLMGADNLAQMPRWWRWTRIFHTARVAVFDRSPYSYGALAGAAARRFAQARTRRSSTIWFRLPPAWTYVAIRRHPASATALRAKKSARG